MAVTPEMGAANLAQLDRVAETLAPYGVGRGYANFAEQKRLGSSNLFDAATVARLREVKDEYDPDDVFRAGYAID